MDDQRDVFESRRIVKWVDALMLIPTVWFDRTNGLAWRKVFALVWFLALMGPCILVGVPVTLLVVFPLMIWDSMK